MQRIADWRRRTLFPLSFWRALQDCQNDPEKVRRVGIQYALEQCHDLLDKEVGGYSFYTLNRSDAHV